MTIGEEVQGILRSCLVLDSVTPLPRRVTDGDFRSRVGYMNKPAAVAPTLSYFWVGFFLLFCCFLAFVVLACDLLEREQAVLKKLQNHNLKTKIQCHLVLVGEWGACRMS